jgi:PadR family transcriptional regulator, regulatory protein PadR
LLKGARPVRVWLAQMRKGLVEPCVLAALSEGESYGYQILQRLGAAGSLGISESTVYPVLARLTAEKLVRVREAPSPNGPPRRYYRLTGLGQARLAEMTASWRQMSAVVNELLEGKADED